MNVLYPRPSAFDGMSWTATPPPYGGPGGHHYAAAGMQFDQQQQLPRHAYHPQSAYAPPQAPLLTNRNYQPIPHPYYSVYAAPFAVQPSPAVNLGNGYFAQHSYPAFAPASYASAQPSYGYEQHAMPPPPYRAQDQVFSQYQQQQQQHDESLRSQSRGRWQGRSSWEGDRPVSNEVWRDERREGYGRNEAAQAATGGEWEQPLRRTQTHDEPRRTVDHDHPSFDRPPHRSNGTAIQQPIPQQVVAPQPQQSSNIEETQAVDDVVYDLVPNISLVPPPPPVERSAVPLADLATEMVWEACLLAVSVDGSRSPSSSASMARWGRLTSKPPSLFNEVTESNRRLGSKSIKVDEVRSSPRMPELFGAIGEGRTRKASSDGCASDDSSPSSSAPGTPAGVGAIDAAAARKQRLMGFGYAIDTKSKGSAIEVRVGGLESPVEAIRTHARRLSNVPGHKSASSPSSTAAFASEPSPAFRQFVKQVLTATLLAPEDLILALYYVARIPSTSLVQPPALEHANSTSAKASAIKAAPFKIILGALMLANKVRSFTPVVV